MTVQYTATSSIHQKALVFQRSGEGVLVIPT
jgi:hypothetical protein